MTRHIFNLLAAFTLVWASPAIASNCYQLNSMDDLEVKWQGFKTLAKEAVPVAFSNFELSGRSKAEGLDNLLKGFRITVKTDEESITSDDEGRNFNIANFFFKKMSGGTDIKGKITEVSNNDLMLEITMNEVTKTVPLGYKLDGDKFKAQGYIDIFDFNLGSQLESITDICAVHEGKTWNDVKIILAAKITSC